METEINEHDKRAFPLFFHLKVRKGFYCHAFFFSVIKFGYVNNRSETIHLQHNADYVVCSTQEDCIMRKR